MWQNSKTKIVKNSKNQFVTTQNFTKLKYLKCYKTEIVKMWQNSNTQILQNSKCDNTQNSNCNVSQKLNTKSQIMTKLEKFNSDYTQKQKYWQKSKTYIVR